MRPGSAKTLGAFALGGIVSPLVLSAIQSRLKRSAKDAIMPVVKPIARDAAKKVIAVGVHIQQLAAEVVADVERPATEAQAEAVPHTDPQAATDG